MCTLVAFHRVRDDYPLVVAANRDELYARRTAPPQLWEGAPRLFAGVDLEKGGTWTGVSERGIYVGLTNQRSLTAPDPTRRSRGEVVVDLLRSESLAALVDKLRQLDAGAFNPFNLMCGDGERLYVAYVRNDGAEIAELAPGVWVLANDRIGSPEFPKAERARALAEPLVALPWDAFVRGAQALLADRTPPPAELLANLTMPPWLPPEAAGALQCLCIHTDRYGTKSSTVIAVEPGRAARFYAADGPPDQAALVEVVLPF